MDSVIRTQLLAVVASGEKASLIAQQTRESAQQLRDTHLALALHRTPSEAIPDLVTCAVSADPAELTVTVHRYAVGPGWKGTAQFIRQHHSTTEEKAACEFTSTAEAQAQNDNSSILRFAVPAMDPLGEYSVLVSITFDPPFTLPAFAPQPLVALVHHLHIDALDSIVPANNATTTADELCVGEIWLTPKEPDNNKDRQELPQWLLWAMLLSNGGRLTECVVAPGTAEFVLAASAAPVSVMCVWERDHVCVRIRSLCRVAYAATVTAVARRLITLGANGSALLSLASRYPAEIDSLQNWNMGFVDFAAGDLDEKVMASL